MTMLIRAFMFLALAAGALLPAACATNPATGRSSFSGLLSSESEAEMGRETHQKVVAEFGGIHDDPDLARYVDGLGQLLASTSERRDVTYTFTVLDSPIVNAFALPGGYVYVTRGLLAIADNEAELAGVIAHEIGHVAARHAAERYSQSLLATIAVIGIGVAGGGSGLADLAGTGAAALLQNYSREQEYEADSLGVRYMTRAGFEPAALASFLETLLANDRLEATLAGSPDQAESFGIMSSHPRTIDRVERAIAAAGSAATGSPILERDVYLGQIDGLMYGDSPEQGYVRGRAFLHPELGFTFEVPAGFRLMNGPNQAIARGESGALVIFDSDAAAGSRDMVEYLKKEWAPEASLEAVAGLDINGYDAATGVTQGRAGGGEVDVRLVAIRFDSGTVYRFLFASPPSLTQRLDDAFRETAYSFRGLAASEAAGLRPQRVRVVKVRPGDTVQRLADAMPFEDYKVERFRVLNGLGPGEPLPKLDSVKIVVE